MIPLQLVCLDIRCMFFHSFPFRALVYVLDYKKLAIIFTTPNYPWT